MKNLRLMLTKQRSTTPNCRRKDLSNQMRECYFIYACGRNNISLQSCITSTYNRTLQTVILFLLLLCITSNAIKNQLHYLSPSCYSYNSGHIPVKFAVFSAKGYFLAPAELTSTNTHQNWIEKNDPKSRIFKSDLPAFPSSV